MTTPKAERDADFAAFVAQASRSLSGTAWLLTGDRDLGAELVQQALVKVYVAWPRVRRADALAYCRRILINLHKDRYRRPFPVPVDADRIVSDAPGEAAVDNRDQVVRLLATLPPRQRAIVVLRYLEDLPEADIAREMGISLGAVKSGLSRALASLREHRASSQGALQ